MSLYVDNISFKYKDRNVICGASIEAGSAMLLQLSVVTDAEKLQC